MVSIRLTGFVFGVLLTFNLLVLRDSFAYTPQAMAKTVVEGKEVSVLAIKKDILDGVPTAAEEEGSGIIGGRKMMKKRKEEISMNGELGSKISSAANNVGNCNHKGKKNHNIDCRLRNRSSTTHHHHHHHVKVKVKTGNFAALNADYHVPKSHPPKNN